jgi:hypothetical protein
MVQMRSGTNPFAGLGEGDQIGIRWFKRDLGIFKIMAIGLRSDDYDHIPVQRICVFNPSLPSQISRSRSNWFPFVMPFSEKAPDILAYEPTVLCMGSLCLVDFAQ